MANSFGQEKQNFPKIFFVDSLEVSVSDFRSLNPNTITLASVYNDSTAFGLIGERGRDGVVYIETIPFAKKRFQNFLKKSSKEYKKKFPNNDSDKNAIYILNGIVIQEIDYGKLALVDEKTLKSINIIDKKELQKSYSINDKDYGIVVTSTEPKEK